LIEHSGGWDFRIGGGRPWVWTAGGHEPQQGYETYGNERGIEPIVIMRVYDHNRPSRVELAQEFRLYHNLFDDRKKSRFLIADPDGNETEAAHYTDSTMEIRTDLLLEFCAAKQMALAIYVNGFAYSKKTLEQLGLSETTDSQKGACFGCNYSLQPLDAFVDDARKTISKVLGKRYVLPGPMPDQRARKPENYQEFIIATQPTGESIRHACDPDALANTFSANPDAPHYLTPVFFRPEVLAKYYADPEKYEVEDGQVRCLGTWSIRIDNDHEDYVVAWLGDLGRDLSENERSYWISYNIPPLGRKISKTNYTRSIRGWFANPRKADLAFKLEYRIFRDDFARAMGWDFFLELHDADQYCFRSLHAPLTENGAEFDDNLINLTKLLVDSLNESEIAKRLTSSVADEKGITKLKRYFEENNLPDGLPHIEFLRKLQELRSTSAAHRKGKKFERALVGLGLEDVGYKQVFNHLLAQARGFVAFLRTAFNVPDRDAPV